MNAEQTFRAKAPWIMALLQKDFPIDLLDAAAIVGNLGHESGGFASMQEISPTAPGSRGGYGWPQWTGPRRRAFEAYCKRNDLNPASDEANYKYLFVELKGYEGSEAGAIPAVKRAEGLKAKVQAFEMAYERAGVKHYASREKWAKRALSAWESATDAQKVPPFKDGRETLSGPPSPLDQSKKAIGAGIGAGVPLLGLTPLIEMAVGSGLLDPVFSQSPVLQAANLIFGTIGGVVGAYVAPKNADPSAPPPKPKGTHMGNYSKAIGALIGGVVGFGVSVGFLPETAQSPEITGALTTVLSLLATYIFPANRSA